MPEFNRNERGRKGRRTDAWIPWGLDTWRARGASRTDQQLLSRLSVGESGTWGSLSNLPPSSRSLPLPIARHSRIGPFNLLTD
ncbi:similar to An11g00590 [Aspergillus luchuensis]|uniref:Similar to An11g00590 n=1 Tax=Aspergillus kawachii TaxID=1069201 RepID=A0A146FKM0_ASPKA|nr:similar to An11g00590 [Aspergillus luchuensis]